MPTTTNLRIITIVVLSIALDSMIGIGTLAYCMVAQIKPDPTLITAFVGITSGLVGALTGLLVNTRTQVTPVPPLNGGGVASVPVVITNPPTDPVPTTEKP